MPLENGEIERGGCARLVVGLGSLVVEGELLLLCLIYLGLLGIGYEGGFGGVMLAWLRFGHDWRADR